MVIFFQILLSVTLLLPFTSSSVTPSWKVPVVSISPHITTDWVFHYSSSILFIPLLSPRIAFGTVGCHSNFSFVSSSTQTQAPVCAHTHEQPQTHSVAPSLVAPSLRTRIPLSVASRLHKWFLQSLGVSLTPLFFHSVQFDYNRGLGEVLVLLLFYQDW